MQLAELLKSFKLLKGRIKIYNGEVFGNIEVVRDAATREVEWDRFGETRNLLSHKVEGMHVAGRTIWKLFKREEVDWH